MSDGKAADSAWDRIDAAVVINLDSRRERWDRLKDSAQGIIPEGKLSRVSAALGVELPGYGVAPWFSGKPGDSRWAARAGCTLSHRRAAETSADNGWETTLILEDDADFSETSKQELERLLAEVFSKYCEWDVCYLGFSKTRGPSRRIGAVGEREIYEISGCAAAHAYIVNAKARDWMINKLPAEERIWPWIALHRIQDRWYSWNMSRSLKVIAVSPSAVTQEGGYSDLVEGDVNYNIEFPGRVVRNASSPIRFYLGRLVWRIKGMGTFIHDALRFLFKRIKGF